MKESYTTGQFQVKLLNQFNFDNFFTVEHQNDFSKTLCNQSDNQNRNQCEIRL